MQRVGIIDAYHTDGTPFPLEAVSKAYRIGELLELLQWAADQGEEAVTLTITEEGAAGIRLSRSGDYELTEPVEGEYQAGLRAAGLHLQA